MIVSYVEKKNCEREAMACAQVPLDEQQVTELDPLGKSHTLPALVSHHLILYIQTGTCGTLGMN